MSAAAVRTVMAVMVPLSGAPTRRSSAGAAVVHKPAGCGWPARGVIAAARQDGGVSSPIAPTRTADPQRPLEPLWRGLLVYRVLALHQRGGGGAARAARLPIAGRRGRGAGRDGRVDGGQRLRLPGAGARAGRRGAIAVADVAVTVAVMASTPFVQTPAQLAADAPVMGSIWTPGAVLACALCFGVRGGLVAASVVSATLLAVQARPETELGDIQLIVLVGLTVGFAATVLRRAGRTAARGRWRPRRPRWSGSGWPGRCTTGCCRCSATCAGAAVSWAATAGELGRLAGEQEFALRTLLTTGPAAVDAAGRRDLAAALRTLGSTRISVATPAHGVELPARVVDELVAVVGAALANVAVHVGPDAPAWVLLEDLGAEVEISVRDDGPGIPAGRLAAAEADGRIGVARSMLGRVRELGGTITCDTGPDRHGMDHPGAPGGGRDRATAATAISR